MIEQLTQPLLLHHDGVGTQQQQVFAPGLFGTGPHGRRAPLGRVQVDDLQP